MIHILIADDDAHIRELLLYHLQTEGYTVFTAADGEEASALWRKNRFTWLSWMS